MRKIISLSILLCILGCTVVEEENLFDSDDSEYVYLQELAAAECVSNATIFDALESAGDFANSGQLDQIYKISQDSLPVKTMYIKITAVSATDITLVYNSSDSTLDKVVTFSKTNHDDIMTELKVMACNPAYSTYFTPGSLFGTDNMTLTWEKESIGIADDDDDGVPETYDRTTDSLIFDNDYPLLFYFYNGTKKGAIKSDEEVGETTGTSTIAITDVTTDAACDSADDDYDSNCEFTTTGFPTCTITVNSGKYLTNAFGDEIISISGTDCLLIDSSVI